MLRKLLFIALFLLTTSYVAQTNTIIIDWSFDSTPSATGNANASRTIKVGETVTWNWYGTGVHNVHNLSSSNESFESQYLGPGGSFSFTFNSVGTNPYQCDPHPSNMFGTITVVAGSLNTNKFASLDKIKMYPNPASSKINFDLNNNEELNVKIYNLLGKEVLNSLINQTNNSIPLLNLSKGIYVAKITSIDGQSFSIKRFVKQ